MGDQGPGIRKLQLLPMAIPASSTPSPRTANARSWPCSTSTRAFTARPYLRVRIEQPEGFEFAVAEIGRGWSKTAAPFSFELDDTYGQFADIHLCQSGIVR